MKQLKNMDMEKFVIFDNTSNTGKEYISEDGSNSIFENAAIFKSSKDAEDFAKTLNGRGNWFLILSYDETDN